MSEFYSVNETQMHLAALCGSGKLGASLEALIISAHHHISRITELEAQIEKQQSDYANLDKCYWQMVEAVSNKATTQEAGE
jgi:predicted dinucleotide-binding enzyme